MLPRNRDELIRVAMYIKKTSEKPYWEGHSMLKSFKLYSPLQSISQTDLVPPFQSCAEEK
jgi:hypothetical protein